VPGAALCPERFDPQARPTFVNDHELIEACRNGDRNAQRELFERTSGRVYRLLLRLTGNPDDAFDLTQETFLKGFTHIDRFDGRSSVATWLHRIAVNEALQYLRRAQTLRRKIDELAGGAATTYDATEAVTGRLDVEDALAQLPPDDRVIVLLRYQEGLDYRTITEVTGVPEGTVASRLNRARERLRNILKPCPEPRRKGYASVEENRAAVHPISDRRDP
jgi:RNA polymerase sigma-70 factor (ECF subfamily)